MRAELGALSGELTGLPVEAPDEVDAPIFAKEQELYATEAPPGSVEVETAKRESTLSIEVPQSAEKLSKKDLKHR